MRRLGLALALALALFALYGCAVSPEIEPPRLAPPAVAAPLQAPAPIQVTAPPPACADGATAPGCTPAAAAATPYDDESTALDDDVDEGRDDLSPGEGHIKPASSPALALTPAALEAQYKKDPASLGSISLGPAHAGMLVNGVQMPKGDHWELLDAGHAWGTRETVDALIHCIDRVNERFPGTEPIPIGHLSAKSGGHLSPHLSHQSGRDVDIGYYHRPGTAHVFVRGTEANLDLPRTWTLVKTALKDADVDMIFIDSAIQRMLVDYAAGSGEDDAFLDDAFQIRQKNPRAPIRHVKGHANHIHFRFHNPVAEALGQRVARFVVMPHPPAAVASASRAEAPQSFAQHKARSGDTLVVLAKRYGTTVEDIQRANGLRTIAIRAGVVYKIPQKGGPRGVPGRVGTVAKKAPSKPAGPARGASSPQR